MLVSTSVQPFQPMALRRPQLNEVFEKEGESLEVKLKANSPPLSQGVLMKRRFPPRQLGRRPWRVKLDRKKHSVMPEKEGATGCLKPTVLPNQWVMLPDTYTVADPSLSLGPPPRRPSLPRPAAADELGTVDQSRGHLAKVSSLPLLGLQYFHGYSDRYSAKEQVWKGFPIYPGRPAVRRMP